MKTSVLVVSSILGGVLVGLGSTAVRFTMARVNVSSAPAASLPAEDVPLTLPPEGGPQPIVVVNAEEFDFGSMEREALGHHDFLFSNKGDYPLEVVLVGTTCKCTSSNLKEGKKIYIDPGQSYEVGLDWKVLTPIDSFLQTATFRTNDPKRRRIELTIKGKVVDSISVEPRDLIFSKIPLGEETTGEVRIYSFVEDDLRALGHKLEKNEWAEHLEVEVEPLSEDQLSASSAKSGLLVRVTAKADLPLGGFQQLLELDTSAQGKTTLEIPIRGFVSGPISIIGKGWLERLSVLRLDEVKSSEGLTRNLNISIRCSDANRITLKTVKVVPDVLKVSIGEKKVFTPTLVHVPLVVEVPRGSPPVSHLGWDTNRMGQIVIETTHPQAKILRLFVRFAVEP